MKYNFLEAEVKVHGIKTIKTNPDKTRAVKQWRVPKMKMKQKDIG